LVEYLIGDGPSRVGRVEGEAVVDLTARLASAPRNLLQLLSTPDWQAAAASIPARRDFALDDLTFEPLLGRTGRVFAAGLNYAKRYPVGTAAPPEPEFPPWFTKAPGTLVGHLQPVVAPAVSDSFDYEAELAAVIGRRGRHVPPAEALDLVAGWTCFNDGSVRHWQRHSVNAGKNFERSGSIGPWLVTADEVADPQALRLQARVDGELRQDASTGEMIFSVAEIISYLSHILELGPGDVVATGSPEGTGGSFDPPRYLVPGQLVEVEIDAIGVLRNPVAAEAQTAGGAARQDDDHPRGGKP
jgi:2-keto-4-pentenoate hydratase/2-oxohepta-3-ene-1,7-dioic acid hydratase in catechol pathway